MALLCVKMAVAASVSLHLEARFSTNIILDRPGGNVQTLSTENIKFFLSGL